ncbi:hypothetical protein Arcpr_1758 [Archaeoglobus profundus DSM 5631]|uniref:Uncharacterized protein n=1 Tax=Archaeoglobus profundus (strain DSM 5631 / JCM 9629 / NBRC 100127 / Av18) TaxID=572546 RepID=D2RFA8_ARCPA|nr:hypothetical protein Arcpr_1758 [Archaeoglobus profundus DSM 5631]
MTVSFTLIEGSTALGAFGVIIIANNSLYEFIRRNFIKFDKEKGNIDTTDIIGFVLLLCAILGILFITGFIGYVIVHSKIIFLKDVEIVEFFVTFCFIATILIPHAYIFLSLNSYFIRNYKIRCCLSALLGGYLGGTIVRFMYAPDLMTAVAMALILLYPLILKLANSLSNLLRKKKSSD